MVGSWYLPVRGINRLLPLSFRLPFDQGSRSATRLRLGLRSRRPFPASARRSPSRCPLSATPAVSIQEAPQMGVGGGGVGKRAGCCYLLVEHQSSGVNPRYSCRLRKDVSTRIYPLFSDKSLRVVAFFHAGSKTGSWYVRFSNAECSLDDATHAKVPLAALPRESGAARRKTKRN